MKFYYYKPKNIARIFGAVAGVGVALVSGYVAMDSSNLTMFGLAILSTAFSVKMLYNYRRSIGRHKLYGPL
jgi:uncharacterized membrane protein YccC